MSLRIVLAFWVVLALSGCDTPASRAQVHRGTFDALSSADRRLVLAGKVHAGMSKAAVYIAWGEPDAKRRTDEGKDPSETWLYRRQLTLQGPMDSFDRVLPGNRVFGAPLALFGSTSGFGFGGVGNEGLTLYQPHVVILGDTIKRAIFKDDRLTRYEEFGAGDAAAR